MIQLEEIRKFFANDHYATDATGLTIEEAEYGHSKVRLTLDERHKNGYGQIMGGVYYTMADFAFAVAANCDPDRPKTLTLSSSAEFMGAAKGTTLFAEASLEKDGSKICFYQVRVFDEQGHVTTAVHMTGYKLS